MYQPKLMYAKWATIGQVEAFINAIKQKNHLNYIRNEVYLSKRKEIILSTYDLVYNKLLDERERRYSIKNDFNRAYLTKKCTCGADVIYIESHGFYGCKNYNIDKTVTHFNFIGKPEHICNYYINYDCNPSANNWINDIRALSDIDKKVSTANLLHFILKNDKEDLSLIFSNRPSEDIVNKFKGAKKRSLVFESEALDYITRLHPGDKINSQQGIRYKYIDRQEKFAICDFIVTSVDKVIIYEAKLDAAYTDEVQKETYIDLVSYMIENQKLNLELEFKYIVKSPNGSIKIMED